MTFREKAEEGRRSPKRWREFLRLPTTRSVLECASPLALSSSEFSFDFSEEGVGEAGETGFGQGDLGRENFPLACWQAAFHISFSEVMKTKFLSLLITPLIFTGCASILDGGSKSVQINSNPEGAKVTISNQEGKTIAVQKTPAIVALARSSGYFRGEDYKLVFEVPGYNPYETHVTSTIDGWYFGNIFFGGLIGMLVVDPITGDMYTLSPMDVNCNLVPVAVPAMPGGIKATESNTNSIPPAEPKNDK